MRDYKKSDLSKVKEGDWIYSVNMGWAKVTRNDDQYNYQVRTSKDETFNHTGHQCLHTTFPSAWTYNPFDLEDQPPCGFTPGEVVAVWNLDSGEDTVFRCFSHINNGLYCMTNRCNWRYARKLTAEERGE